MDSKPQLLEQTLWKQYSLAPRTGTTLTYKRSTSEWYGQYHALLSSVPWKWENSRKSGNKPAHIPLRQLMHHSPRRTKYSKYACNTTTLKELAIILATPSGLEFWACLARWDIQIELWGQLAAGHPTAMNITWNYPEQNARRSPGRLQAWTPEEVSIQEPSQPNKYYGYFKQLKHIKMLKERRKKEAGVCGGTVYKLDQLLPLKSWVTMDN